MRRLLTIAAAAVVSWTTPVVAQQADQQPQAGPLAIEKIQNGSLSGSTSYQLMK